MRGLRLSLAALAASVPHGPVVEPESPEGPPPGDWYLLWWRDGQTTSLLDIQGRVLRDTHYLLSSERVPASGWLAELEGLTSWWGPPDGVVGLQEPVTMGRVKGHAFAGRPLAELGQWAMRFTWRAG